MKLGATLRNLGVNWQNAAGERCQHLAVKPRAKHTALRWIPVFFLEYADF